MNNEKFLCDIIEQKRQPLEVECYKFFEEEGFKFLPYYYATSEEEMNDIIEKMMDDRQNKYVFKVMSPRILHKSDFKAVILKVSAEEAMETYINLKEKFANLGFEGVLIVPMAQDGVELIVGSTFDDTFGYITIFGIGGVFVEVLKDVTFGKSPLTKGDAKFLIDSIKSQDLLNGPRGLPKLNRSSMEDFLVKFSKVSCKYKEIIKEIDLNPVRITPQGIFPLDARIVFHAERC